MPGHNSHIIIKEPNFTLVPSLGRVLFSPARFVRIAHLQKQLLVPFAINVPAICKKMHQSVRGNVDKRENAKRHQQDLPMLHGVTDITGLDEMLNHDSGLTVPVFNA